MSTSNAAAIRRRVGSQNNSNSSSNLASIPENPTVNRKETTKTLTMTEMITLLNSRIVVLEKNINQDTNVNVVQTQQELQSLANEINIRFELFANEIANMKDTVMKLQTYTMDVNKMLMNERIQILSNTEQTDIDEPEFQELDTNENTVFNVLNPKFVTRQPIKLDTAVSLRYIDGEESGITIIPFAVPGKVALWLEDSSKGDNFGSEEEDTIALEVRGPDGKTLFFYIPGCANMPEWLKNRVNQES